MANLKDTSNVGGESIQFSSTTEISSRHLCGESSPSSHFPFTLDPSQSRTHCLRTALARPPESFLRPNPVVTCLSLYSRWLSCPAPLFSLFQGVTLPQFSSTLKILLSLSQALSPPMFLLFLCLLLFSSNSIFPSRQLTLNLLHSLITWRSCKNSKTQVTVQPNLWGWDASVYFEILPGDYVMTWSLF